MPEPNYTESDLKASTERIDGTVAPLLDIPRLYKELNRDRKGGLSKREINTDYHRPDSTAAGQRELTGNIATSLAVLKLGFEEFRALDRDNNPAITRQDRDKFSKIPPIIAMRLVSGDAVIRRFLDANKDKKIDKNEVSEFAKKLEESSPTKHAVDDILSNFEIISKGKDHIDRDSFETAVRGAYAELGLSSEEEKFTDTALTIARDARKAINKSMDGKISSKPRPDTFQVLQSHIIGDCYALSDISSVIARDPKLLGLTFKENNGNLEMIVPTTINGQDSQIKISTPLPSQKERAIYASSRGDAFLVNAIEKTLGDFARQYPKEWAKIIGVTPDPIINLGDNSPPSEHLDGGGISAGLLSLFTRIPYGTFSFEQFRNNNKLEEVLKNVGSKAPMSISLPTEWLHSGNPNSSGSVISGDGIEGIKSKRSDSGGSSKEKRDLHETDMKKPDNPRSDWDIRFPKMGDHLMDRKMTFGDTGPKDGIREVDPKPVPRNNDSKSHAVAVIDYNPTTRTFTLYNSWGFGEGSKKDGNDDGIFELTVEELKQLDGSISLPKTAVDPSSTPAWRLSI